MQSYYVYDYLINGHGRSFATYAREIESPSHLLEKRFNQSYHYFFIIMGIRPFNLLDTVQHRKNPMVAVKQSGMQLLTKVVSHYSHTALALVCQRIGGGFMSSLVKEYDAKDRYTYLYFSRLLSKLRIPSALAILIGVPHTTGDEAHFDQPSLSPIAASEDACKRVILYETADVMTRILFSDIIAPRYKLDRELYDMDRNSIPTKITRCLFIIAGAEVGALVGRFIGNKIDEVRGHQNDASNSIAGTCEFWATFVGSMAGCPVGTNLGNKKFPAEKYAYEIERDMSDEQESLLK